MIGEVASLCIILIVSKLDFVRMSTIGIGAVRPKGGHLDVVPKLANDRHAELCSDQLRPSKNVLDLLGAGAGRDIEILGGLRQEFVTNTSTCQQCRKPRIAQFLYDMKRGMPGIM